MNPWSTSKLKLGRATPSISYYFLWNQRELIWNRESEADLHKTVARTLSSHSKPWKEINCAQKLSGLETLTRIPYLYHLWHTTFILGPHPSYSGSINTTRMKLKNQLQNNLPCKKIPVRSWSRTLLPLESENLFFKLPFYPSWRGPQKLQHIKVSQ